MESDIDYAIEELESLQFRLERHISSKNLDSTQKQQNGTTATTATTSEQDITMPNDLLQPVTLLATIDPTKGPVSFQTTFGRELWFCSLHAVRIRHLAAFFCLLFYVMLMRQSSSVLYFLLLRKYSLLHPPIFLFLPVLLCLRIFFSWRYLGPCMTSNDTIVDMSLTKKLNYPGSPLCYDQGHLRRVWYALDRRLWRSALDPQG